MNLMDLKYFNAENPHYLNEMFKIKSLKSLKLL